jgi:hypothetical protein
MCRETYDTNFQQFMEEKIAAIQPHPTLPPASMSDPVPLNDTIGVRLQPSQLDAPGAGVSGQFASNGVGKN